VIRRVSPASWAMIAAGGVSQIYLLLGDPNWGYAALGLNVYMLLLWWATVWATPGASTETDVLRAAGPRSRVALRSAVVVLALLGVFAYSVAVNGAGHVPVFSPLMHAWSVSNPPFGTTAIPNFVLYALIPGLLVLALGAKRRELGLTAPRAGTLRAALAALVLPAIFCAWALFAGKLGIAALGYVVVRNFLSSGFSEEFLVRGLALSHLRAYLTTEWAVFAQAMLFAIFHAASSLDEPGIPLLIAYLIATSAIQGYVLGLIALRTRSLALPVLIHTTLGMMKEALT